MTSSPNSHKRDNNEVEIQMGTDASHSGHRRWFVLIAAFVSSALSFGFPFNMTVLYVEWLEEFGKSNSETSLIQAVCTGIFATGGVLCGLLVKKFGPRKCSIVCGVMNAVGLSISYFGTSITFLVFSLSVVTGMSCSLGYVSAVTCVSLYFSGNKRVLAIAFTAFGVGCGSSVFPVLIKALVDAYDWRGSLLILAGIMLHLTLMGCIYKMPSNTRTTGRKQIEANSTGKDSNKKGASPTDILQTKIMEKPKEDCLSKYDKDLSSITLNPSKASAENINKKRYSCGIVLTVLQQIRKNGIFLCFCIPQALCLGTVNSSLIFFVDYHQSKGLTRSDGVNIYFYMMIISTFFMFAPGPLKQLPHVSVLLIPAISSVIGSVALALFPVTGKLFELNVVVACTYGISIAGIKTSVSTPVAKLVETKNYSIGVGIVMTFGGLFTIAAGPISGLVRDITGNYDTLFFCYASSMMLSAILFFLLIFYRRYTRCLAQKHDMKETKDTKHGIYALAWRRNSKDISVAGTF